MSGIHISSVKMCGAFTAAILACLLTSSQAIPTVFSNEVYPDSHLDPSSVLPSVLGELPPPEPPFSLTITRNMSSVVDMREFIMKYVEDERICTSDSMRDLILGNGKSDRSATGWWAKRCNRRSTGPKGTSRNLPESTLVRYRRKSSNRASSQQSLTLSKSDQKKLTKLMKNKKIQCNPKKAVVELPNTNAPFTMLKPSCVYINQCSGCCDSHHLECRPTKIKKRKFKVLSLEKKLTKAGAVQFHNEQTLKTVVVQEHKACQCQCKEREEHCTARQTYDADACRCQCPAELIKSCPPGKVWNEKQCDCVCSDISECTTGRYFDTETCRCLRN